jgi:uncharacterized protein
MYIDNLKFAKSGQSISGELDLSLVARIQEIEEYSGVIKFELSGAVDSLNRPTLKLNIHGIITTLCQNCLQPMDIQLDNSSDITIFFTEEQLDKALFSEDVDHGAEDGVLVEQEFDVMNLVEDEVIVSLPYVSKHDACVGLSYHDDSTNPFGVLKKII